MASGVGGRCKTEGPYAHLWLSHTDVWRKPTQPCKAITLQLKINTFFFKKQSPYISCWTNQKIKFIYVGTSRTPFLQCCLQNGIPRWPNKCGVWTRLLSALVYVLKQAKERNRKTGERGRAARGTFWWPPAPRTRCSCPWARSRTCRPPAVSWSCTGSSRKNDAVQAVHGK